LVGGLVDGQSPPSSPTSVLSHDSILASSEAPRRAGETILAPLRLPRGVLGRRDLAQGLRQARGDIKGFTDGQEGGAEVTRTIGHDEQSARLGQEVIGA
jgi:hypothetical protein